MEDAKVGGKVVHSIYERSDDMNPTLLELAKLDFNMVQATYQEDLRHLLMYIG